MNTSDSLALIQRLLHSIAPEADVGAINGQGPLQEQLDLDSMDFLNLVTAVHDATGLEIPERDYPLLASLDGFVEYLTSHVHTAA